MTDTITSLAQQIRPFWLRDLGASSPLQNGGGSGMIAHALNGPYHTGTLDQSQAPWAVDTTTFTAHTGNPDAHHTKLHGIVDTAHHSGAGGLQYQIVGFPTNGGLGLLTPASSPGANAIVKTDGASSVTLVDLTVTSDLFIVGVADFGTNTIYEDASYLQVTGSKTVRFGQAVGTPNWQIALNGSAQFHGTVDISNGGDLTVAGSGSYAGNQVLFADSSGGNVGIMMAPDSQFALDINGPARATYWIGPHAIQLKNVLLLSHFDGRAPYETNYSGEVNGHMGQVAIINGGLIFRPGKFYKAAQLAEDTTNLITNPSFETGITGWTAYSGGSVAHSGVRSLYGVNCLLATVSSNGQGVQASSSGLSASTNYTLSVYVYTTTARSISLHATDNIDKDMGTTTIAIPAFIWTRLSLSFTTDSHTTVYYQVTANGSTNLYVDGAQLEAKAYATPYCDGTLGGYDVNGVPDGSAHAWTGTAHASTSTRAAGRLAYAQAGNVDSSVGTLSVWVNFASLANYRYILASSSNGGIGVYAGATTLSVARVNTETVTNTTVTWAAETWYHIAVTWSGTAITVYRNGVQIATGTASAGFATPSSYYVGRSLEGTYFLDGLIDDLCILGRAADAAEIRSIYESNAPVFAETSTFTFRPTPKGLIWADDEGLWMRDSSGNSVLGIYGGEAATKSWAGFTMAAGDIVFGRNAVGSSAIWWDQSAGTFGFYGAGSGTPQVEIATDGKLTAGAGKVKLDSTGFHAFNASAVATIDINADGIYLGDGGARTTIGSWTSGNRIRAYNVGEIYEATPETYLDDSSISRTLYPLVIRGIRQGNESTLVEISAVNTSNVGARIIVGEGFRLKGYFTGSGNSYQTNRVVHALADDVILEASNLQLYGMTTNAGAVGTYAGKIRVRIAGTDRYIPYYAS